MIQLQLSVLCQERSISILIRSINPDQITFRLYSSKIVTGGIYYSVEGELLETKPFDYYIKIKQKPSEGRTESMKSYGFEYRPLQTCQLQIDISSNAFLEWDLKAYDSRPFGNILGIICIITLIGGLVQLKRQFFPSKV